jgi:hypothetical protein
MDSGNSESLGVAFPGLSVEPGTDGDARDAEPQHGSIAVAVAVVLGVMSVSLRLLLLAPFMGLRAALRFPWAETPDALRPEASGQGAQP